MFFTREDIEKIHQGLLRLGIKDSELPETINVNSDDTLAIVQDGKNKKINIEEFFNNISLFKKEGFINITDRFNKHSISLIEAIQTVPTHQRIDGLVITFEDINGDWRIYQFRGDAVDFFDENKWTDLYDYTNYIVKSITPDEEDLTVSKPDKNGNAIVSLKDRVYDESNFSGKGYKILRKNIQTIDGVRNNILAQDMINEPNTIYEIRYDFDLNGKRLVIPENCVLKFTGGKLSNGQIIGQNTSILAPAYQIFGTSNSYFRGYTKNGYKYVVNNGDAIVLGGTWRNESCFGEWVGLTNDIINDINCHSLLINNFIVLHRLGANIKFPASLNLYVYDTIHAENYNVNFSNCVFSIPDYSLIEDTTIELPDGATPTSLRHPNALFWIGGNGYSVSNAIIDERSTERGEDAENLGIQFTFNEINNTSNFSYNNIYMKNIVDCGVQENNTIHDITYNNVTFENVGEHGIYSYSYIGKHHFNKCKFINCGQSDKLQAMRGASACYRPSISGEALENATINVYFNDCLFKCDGTHIVLTCYEGIPKIYFVGCAWVGSKIHGYGGYSSYDVAKRVEERIFENCDNPCTVYGNNGKDTVRSIINCKNVTNSIKNTRLIQSCDCIVRYTDEYTLYSDAFASEFQKPLEIYDSLFRLDEISLTQTSYMTMRNKGRSIEIHDCRFELMRNDYLNPQCIAIQGSDGDIDVRVYNTVIDCHHMTFIYSSQEHPLRRFELFGCSILRTYTYFSDVSTNYFFMNNCISGANDDLGRFIRTVNTRWEINGFTEINASKSRYYQNYIVANIGDGGTITLRNTKNMVPSSTLDLLQYVRIEQIGGNVENFSYTIVNNGSVSDSVLTLNGTSTPHSYRVIIDFTKYPR